jgi:hypothetical protein
MEKRGARRYCKRTAMYKLLGLRSTDCEEGTEFYRCAINRFEGCCSVDPCSMTSTCPDAAPVPSDDEERFHQHPTPSYTGKWGETATSSTTVATSTASGTSRDTEVVLGDGRGNSGGGGSGLSLSPAAIAGIAVGSALLILGLIMFASFRRWKTAREGQVVALDDSSRELDLRLPVHSAPAVGSDEPVGELSAQFPNTIFELDAAEAQASPPREAPVAFAANSDPRATLRAKSPEADCVTSWLQYQPPLSSGY